MRCGLVVAGSMLLGGCLEVEQLTYRFDLVNGKGTLVFQNITSDDKGSVWADFAELVNDYLIGGAFAKDNPGWRVEDQQLFEHQGELRATMRFAFDEPIDVGLYRHDKRSAWLWCANAGLVVTATSGQVVPPYPNCVTFDRKTRELHITVRDGAARKGHSLLPAFATWQGGPFDGRRPEAKAGVGALLPDVAVTGLWKELGLPLPNSKVVHVSDKAFASAHEATVPDAIVVLYEAHLTKRGYLQGPASSEGRIVEQAGQRITITATEAGSSAIVSLALSPVPTP